MYPQRDSRAVSYAMVNAMQTKSERRPADYARRGLSLVEIAIVLGIMGVVTSGIWAMVIQGWEQARREQAEEALMGIVRDTRSYYSGQPGIPQNATYKTVTDALLRSHAIPGNLLRNPDCRATNSSCIADTPWGSYEGNAVTYDGTLRVCGWDLGNVQDPCYYGKPNTTTSQFFGVTFLGLKLGSCIALASKVASGLGGPTGLIEVNINGCSISSSVGCKANVDMSKLASTLNAECDKTKPNPAHVTFVYRMALPTN